MGRLENIVQKACLEYLETMRRIGVVGKFWRQNNGGFYLKKKDCYIKPKSLGYIDGVPDIAVVMADGRYVGVECKSPKGVMSSAQTIFKEDLQRCRTDVIVAKSVDDLQRGLLTFILKTHPSTLK